MPYKNQLLAVGHYSQTISHIHSLSDMHVLRLELVNIQSHNVSNCFLHDSSISQIYSTTTNLCPVTWIQLHEE